MVRAFMGDGDFPHWLMTCASVRRCAVTVPQIVLSARTSSRSEETKGDKHPRKARLRHAGGGNAGGGKAEIAISQSTMVSGVDDLTTRRRG